MLDLISWAVMALDLLDLLVSAVRATPPPSRPPEPAAIERPAEAPDVGAESLWEP